MTGKGFCHRLVPMYKMYAKTVQNLSHTLEYTVVYSLHPFLEP